jgi:hypothetical protein
MKYNTLTTTALVLLTACDLLALPKPVACWKADGQEQGRGFFSVKVLEKSSAG